MAEAGREHPVPDKPFQAAQGDDWEDGAEDGRQIATRSIKDFDALFVWPFIIPRGSAPGSLSVTTASHPGPGT